MPQRSLPASFSWIAQNLPVVQRDEHDLAMKMCGDLLTLPDLKKICQYRGWSPVGSSKEELAAFVAPRLPGPEGVAQAMATLDEASLFLLHRFALFPLSVHVRDLSHEQLLSRRSAMDYRAHFRSLVDHLLCRGLALATEGEYWLRRSESRFSRLTFMLPRDHLPLLPAMPGSTEPLGDDASRPDTGLFCKEALSLALRQAGVKEPSWPQGLLGKLASSFSFEKDALSLHGKQGDRVGELGDLTAQVVALWMKSMGKASGKASGKAAKAAVHVLTYLPPGQGCSPDSLARAVARFGEKLKPEEAELFLQQGHRAGFLLAGVAKGGRTGAIYAARGAGDPKTGQGEPRLSLKRAEDGKSLTLDLDASDLGPVLELAGLSLVAPLGGGLLGLRPSVLHLGRAAGRLDALGSLRLARSVCVAYEQAVQLVMARGGKTVLHNGLALLRIEDVGLMALVSHRMGDRVRTLDERCLAVQSGALGEALDIIKKEGFSPRRVS